MEKLLTLSLLGAVLAMPLVSNAWVAYNGGAYAAGTYWHGGWSCGGVTTGTPLAAGTAALVTGSTIASSSPQGGQVISAATEQGSQYVSAATEHGSQYISAATELPPLLTPPSAPIGSICYVYPGGAQPANINGVQYYVLGNNYYRAYFGNNGVYYQVVPKPT